MLHIRSSVRVAVAASDGDDADKHDRCGNTPGVFFFPVRGELGLPSQKEMHRPSHQSCFWAGGHRATPASRRVFVLTPLLASGNSTQHVNITQLALEHAPICMFGGCYAARSPLIFSDRRSRDSGSLLSDHRVWNEDKKPQMLLRSTASYATSVKVRVCMRTCVNGKEDARFLHLSLCCQSAALSAHQEEEKRHLDYLKNSAGSCWWC